MASPLTYDTRRTSIGCIRGRISFLDRSVLHVRQVVEEDDLMVHLSGGHAVQQPKDPPRGLATSPRLGR
jgi:hypothetical protein